MQWECKADMDNLYRFGSVEVVCEGYDYPDDPYILKGSCGLEYTLELTKEGQNKNQGIIQFHFFDTIGLTNLLNARYFLLRNDDLICIYDVLQSVLMQLC